MERDVSTLGALERLTTTAERYLDGGGYLAAFQLRCAIANAKRYQQADYGGMCGDGHMCFDSACVKECSRG